MAEKYIINMPLKTTPADTDLMIIEDAQDTKRMTWANVVKPIGDLVAAHEAESANLAHGGAKGTLIANIISSQSIPNEVETPVVFPSSVYDTNSFFNVAVPTRITIPSGVSKVKLSANVSWAVASGERWVAIKKNGGNFIGMPYAQYNAVANARYNISTNVLNVSVGDYFELFVYQSSGGALLLQPANSLWLALEVVE